MLAIFMKLMMEANQPHHNPLPVEFIRDHRVPIGSLSIREECMDGGSSGGSEA